MIQLFFKNISPTVCKCQEIAYLVARVSRFLRDLYKLEG